MITLFQKEYMNIGIIFFLIFILVLSTSSVLSTEVISPIYALNFDSPVIGGNGISYVGDIELKNIDSNQVFDATKGGGQIAGIQTLNTDGGGLSLWVYPMWNHADTTSQVLLTMPWMGSDSYLAISYGWWEPKGSGRLYFILSNKDYVHCSSPYSFESNVWSMVSVSWSKKENGFITCEIYVNGDVITKQRVDVSNKKIRKTAGSIYLGNDKGATDSRGRTFVGYLDNIKVFDTAPKQSDYITLYDIDSLSGDSYESDTWRWIKEYTKETQAYQSESVKENRIIFDEGIAWATSKRATDKILNRIKTAGFNIYVPVVWHGRGAYFPSNIAHIDDRLKTVISEYDPLAYLLQKAHDLGIEVHPWFTVVKREDEKYPQYYNAGTPAGAYNVKDKAFQGFMIDLMMEVVKKYPVDGINLDYIRTMGMCFSEHCVQSYKKTYNRELRSDYLLRFVNAEAKQKIQAWQEQPVDEIVKNISRSARKIKPNIKISVDMHSQTDVSNKTIQGRNSGKWLRQGWVDYIFDMQYGKRINYKQIKSFTKSLDDKSRHIVLMANYDKIDDEVIARPGYVVNALILYNREETSNDSVAFYLYSRLSDDQVQSLRTGAFSNAAQTAWK